jgi:hypothetical protein
MIFIAVEYDAGASLHLSTHQSLTCMMCIQGRRGIALSFFLENPRRDPGI